MVDLCVIGQEGDIFKTIMHKQSKQDCLEAWRSHATLHRQAGEKFDTIIESIAEYLTGIEEDEIVIPYTTKIWMAQVR